MWRVELLGTLQASADDVSISRFRTRRVGLLLAYLAYYGEQSHSRDELAEMLWPESETELARRNLRQALSSLRHHLEPPSVPSGAVLIAKQSRVSVAPQHVTTDVAEFRRLVRLASATADNSLKSKCLMQAVELYRGDLLPGYYEEWVQRERLNLEDMLVAALQALVRSCEAEGRVDEAIRYVRLALSKDRLREDLHASLMRLYLAAERPASAVQHFQDWKETLASELGDEPGSEMTELSERAKRAGAGLGSFAPTAGPKTTAPEQPLHDEPPPPASISRVPVQLTRFFGRGEDKSKALECLSERGDRLVTVVGAPGTGKTRLAIEAGRALAELHSWNVWFVPLADFSDGSMTLDAVVDAMKLRKTGSASPLDLIQANLTGSQNLLILDNLEHLLESAAPSVETILREIAGVSVLITSRQNLKLDGEQLIRLDTLPVPDDQTIESGRLDDLSLVPSVQLFVDRAQAVLPDFQLTRHNARAVATICVTLDGLPLALEIAAGLSNAFGPAQLLQNLENRLELLRSRRRDLGPRHRSLRAAIDYSHDLLTPELQSFFMALSVFRGGFTIGAAERVCLPEPDTALKTARRRQAECLRMVLELQERSLVRSEEAEEGCPARFRLLESFREYGAELLEPDEALELRNRHGRYYLEYSLALTEGHRGYRAADAGTDRENRMAALEFFFEQGATHECVSLLTTLQTFSYTGRETIQALSKPGVFEKLSAIDQIALQRMMAITHLYASEYQENHDACQRALEIAELLGQEDQIALCHHRLSVACSYLGRREESMAHCRWNLEYGLRTGDLHAVESGYVAIGDDYWSVGDFISALSSFEGALEASRKLHNGEPFWLVLYNLARVHLDVGNLDEGLDFAGQGLRSAQRGGEEFGISMSLSLISRYHRLRGNLVAALATSHEALIRRRKVGFKFWTLNAIQWHANVMAQMGRYKEAATLLAASRGATKMGREIDNREYAEGVEAAKANLSEQEFEQAWAEGLAMGVDEAFRLAAAQV